MMHKQKTKHCFKRLTFLRSWRIFFLLLCFMSIKNSSKLQNSQYFSMPYTKRKTKHNKHWSPEVSDYIKNWHKWVNNTKPVRRLDEFFLPNIKREWIPRETSCKLKASRPLKKKKMLMWDKRDRIQGSTIKPQNSLLPPW